MSFLWYLDLFWSFWGSLEAMFSCVVQFLLFKLRSPCINTTKNIWGEKNGRQKGRYLNDVIVQKQGLQLMETESPTFQVWGSQLLGASQTIWQGPQQICGLHRTPKTAKQNKSVSKMAPNQKSNSPIPAKR